MCRALVGLKEIGDEASRRYFDQLPPFRQAWLNEPFVEVIARVTAPILPEFAERMARLREAEHGIGPDPVDLLKPAYSGSAYGQLDFMTDGVAFYRAHNDSVRFFVVSERVQELRFRACLRTPSREASDVVVTLNGKTILAITVGRTWTTTTFAAAAEVRRGINDLVFHWPSPEIDGDEELRRRADDIARAPSSEFFPVFGELHTLQAVVAPGPASWGDEPR
jgi:hypothetical protein